MRLISDINAAFFGNEKYIGNLQKLYDEIMGHDQIKWEADKNWKERLLAYKR